MLDGEKMLKWQAERAAQITRSFLTPPVSIGMLVFFSASPLNINLPASPLLSLVSITICTFLPASNPGPIPITREASVIFVLVPILVIVASTTTSGCNCSFIIASVSMTSVILPWLQVSSISLIEGYIRIAVMSQTVFVPSKTASEKAFARLTDRGEAISVRQTRQPFI